MGKGLFTDKDKGWKELTETIEGLGGGSHVFVGFLRSSGVYKPKKNGEKSKPISIAQVAGMHEFGAPKAGIPERSFMRSTLASQGPKLEKLLAALSLAIINGGMSPKKALGVVGQFLKQSIQAKITSGVPPANKPATVRRKGSDRTLIDTGQMLNAVDFEVREKKK